MTTKPIFEIISKENRIKILDQAYRLLENNGVKVCSEKALNIFAENGCTVTGNNVKIPKSLILKSIESAPSMIEMYDRNGNHAMSIGGHNSYFGPGPTCPNYYDPRTGKRRPAKKEDAATTALIADALEHIDFVMSLVMIGDRTKELADIHEVDAMVRNTTKPLLSWAFNADNLQVIIDLCATVAGGLEQLQEKPFLAVYCEPTTPFVHTKDALEKVIMLAENKIPCIYTPGMILGGTAPVTVAGALTVGLVDSLTGLVLSQLVQKGAPFIGAASGGPMDMRTMQHSYGAPEWVLCHNASTEIFHEINIPVFNAAGCSDTQVVDAQSAFEASIQIFAAMATGGNITHDIGFMDLGISGSPLQMVMCNEFIGYMRRLMEGVCVDEDHLAEETIISVGPGGNFLTEDHTLDFYEEELWTPEIMKRENFESWHDSGSKTLTERAQDLMNSILDSHTPEPLPDSILAKLDAIVENREQTFFTKL